MSSKGATSKTYKRYPPQDALKRGSATTIDSACTKMIIANAHVELREKFKILKTEYQKSKVKLEQMEQLKKDNYKLIADGQKKNDTIKNLHITITQLNSDIKLLKETTSDRADYQRLEGFLKKKDHEIEELKKQINSTKINNVEHLKNTIHQQNEQIKYLKEGYGKFNVVDESLSKANQGLKEENELLKEGLDRLKEEHGELIEKLDKFQKVITEIYDDF
jgi:chromosome segregation ATPase